MTYYEIVFTDGTSIVYRDRIDREERVYLHGDTTLRAQVGGRVIYYPWSSIRSVTQSLVSP